LKSSLKETKRIELTKLRIIKENDRRNCKRKP